MARTASANKKRITALAPGAGHIRIQKDAKFSPCRLHSSSLFQCPSPALPCGRQIRWQRVLLPYLGTASDKKLLPALRITWPFCLQSFFPPDAGSRDRDRHASSHCPGPRQRKKFLPAGHGSPGPPCPARIWSLPRHGIRPRRAHRASGSERCNRASNALAGGQFLPRQIKGSPVQHRIRQEGSPCCWSVCGVAWRYAEKTASLPCRWRCGRKEGSAQVCRPSEAAVSRGQRSYGLRSYLPASALFTAVKPVTSSAVTDIDCRARVFPFPQTSADNVDSPESVFCLNRLALQSIRLSCRGKYVFSARFRPDGTVPHLTFSLFQRQNAPAGSKERIFCLPFSERRPLPSGPGHETFTQRGNSAVPP